METYQNYINGEWVDSNSEVTVPNLNPADPADTIGTVRLSTLEDLRWAIGSAEASLIEWKTIPVQERAEFLNRARDILGNRKEEITADITREEGKSPKEAREELNHTIRLLKWMAGEASRLTTTSEKSRYTIRQSLGVVGIMTPFNMPLAAPFWKISPALLAGCAVVFTPSALTPLSAIWVAKVFQEAGLPPGVLNLVHTSEETASDVLLDHPAVRAISFTGRPETGKKLAEGSARKGKKVQCEMGGKNPAIVLEDANLEQAADDIVQGAFGSAGQRCTATSRVIVEDQVAEKLLELIEKRLSQFESSPVISEERLNGLLEAIEIARKDGATLRTGGKRMDREGWFLEPTLFDDVSPRTPLAQEDLFGPILSIQRVGHFEQALIVANEVKYGLSASLHTKNPLKISRFIEEIDAGIAHINAPTTADEPELPFGGRKASGHGLAEMGTSAIDFYTEQKAVYLGPSGP